MARYFKTTNASRRFKAGGLAFVFEPVEQIGGNWLGLLAVADEAAANSLAGAGYPQVKEITSEAYEAQKKKPQAQNVTFRVTLPEQDKAESKLPHQAAGHAAEGVASIPLSNNTTLRYGNAEPKKELL